MRSFIGGLGAGLFSVLTTSPFDVVKTRMQSVEAKNYKGTADCFAQIFAHEGPFAFFNGTGASQTLGFLIGHYVGALARSARVVPGQGIIFVCVDVFYDWIASSVAKT